MEYFLVAPHRPPPKQIYSYYFKLILIKPNYFITNTVLYTLPLIIRIILCHSIWPCFRDLQGGHYFHDLLCGIFFTLSHFIRHSFNYFVIQFRVVCSFQAYF